MLRRFSRRRSIALVSAVVLFFFFSILLLGHYQHVPSSVPAPPSSQHQAPVPASSASDESARAPWPISDLHGSTWPMNLSTSSIHPIQHLSDNAKKQFSRTLAKQSTTLEDAVGEYRKRYGIAPPPHFDKWFEFAQSNRVQLIDEFDTIYDLILPFWGLKPATIRGRAKEALGFDNWLLGIAIRNHTVSFTSGDSGWQLNATLLMLQNILPYLPDMDLAFNLHDEPRVVVPHDDLTRLIDRARRTAMPAASAHASPANEFTATSPELSNGPRFDDIKLTRFNQIPHEATWTTSRLSCAPDTPARMLDDDEQEGGDDLERYALTRAGFVYNTTAMSDICLTPSLSKTYGFFDRPNAFKVTHDLFPIFSQSKLSSFADLIYPSPWYWYGKFKWDETRDMPWSKKTEKLFWRGSTTGGFSRNGGWRRQHRQKVVAVMNNPTDALIFVDNGSNSKSESSHDWSAVKVPRGDHRELVDVHFSHVGQCDDGDCQAQNQFFTVKEQVDMQDAAQYRFLLDVDGNAFSGRFYGFLRSLSQVFKLAISREWHAERLQPWLHYAPLSMQSSDWLAVLHYYATTEPGRPAAEEMANASRDWAAKALRKVDMEAWLFRLLLEYARVIDPNREIIGFDLASADKKLP